MGQPLFSPDSSAIVAEYRRRFGNPDDREPVRSSEHLQDQPEHELVITAKPNTNGRVLTLRCRCMAEYRNVSRRYYNYDPFAETGSLDEAVRLYDEHCRG